MPGLQSVLRLERQKHALTQKEVAEKLGTSEKQVSRWENGNYVPSPFYRRKLAEVYGISPSALYESSLL